MSDPIYSITTTKTFITNAICAVHSPIIQYNNIFIENCVHNFYAERMCGFAGKAILHMKT